MLKGYMACAVAAVCLAAVGCSLRKDYTVVEGVMLGTSLRVVADVEGVGKQELYAAVMELDREAKASMSIFDEGSLLSRLNRNETDSVDRHIAYCLRLADSIGALSSGRYDVTVKPLVEAWGFAGKEPAREPNLDSLLEFVGREKVAVRDGRLFKSDPRVQLDFNSVAKGYTVDLLAGLVERFGAQNYLVDIGGEVRCKGRNREGDKWRVGIETPYDGNEAMDDIQRIISVTDAAVATSGNYRRFWYDDKGRKIAHTIDPRTGLSAVSQLLSVTVVAPTCAEADAAGTMLLAAGSDDAEALAEELDGMLVYFIFAGEAEGEYRVVCSDGLEEMFADAQ